MMDTEILDNQTSSGDSDSFSPQTMAELSSLGKWMKMTAILGFIQMPISIYNSLKLGNFINVLATVLGVIFTIILLNAANGLQAFCKNPNPFDLAKFGGNIRNYYTFIGILIIIIMAFLGLFIIIGIISSL